MTASTLGYTPGSGASVATDLDGGAHHQKAVVEYLTAAGGVPTPVSEQAPMPVAAYGELMEAIEAMRQAVQALTRTIGLSMPDTSGRLRVNVDAGTVGVVQATAASLQMTATLAANQVLGTLNNQVSVGANFANDQIPALMHLQADSLRRNITVT